MGRGEKRAPLKTPAWEAKGTQALICKLQMEIKYEIKPYLFCFILESAVMRSEMEIVLRCEN